MTGVFNGFKFTAQYPGMFAAKFRQRLNGDIQLVVEYGRAHDEEWGGVRFVREPRGAIEAAFTTNPSEHLAALHRIVQHPDRVRVVEVRFTQGYRRTVQDDVVAWLREHHPD